MKPITDRTLLFSAAVALIYESAVVESRREAVKRSLCKLLDADELVFTTTSEAQRTGDFLRSASASSPDQDKVTAYQPDPFDQPSSRPAGHILSLDILDRGYDKLRLLILRNPGRPPFSESDLEWLSLLRPHLQKAEFAKTLMPDGILGCAVGSQLQGSISAGLLIVNAASEIEWLNPSAQHILAADQGLSSLEGRLRAGRAFETARLEELVRQAVYGSPGVMLVGNASMWLPYGLVFTPLSSESGLVIPGTLQRRFVLVTIKDMRRHIDVIVGRLADVFGLSKAEQQIASLLLTGYGLKVIAKTAGKSLTTVKKQLRSMLTKTGAHSQAELLGMLLSVPSWI